MVAAIAASVIDALDNLFGSELGDVVGGVAQGVGLLRVHAARAGCQFGHGKAIEIGGKHDHGFTDAAHAGLGQSDAGDPPGTALTRLWQAVEHSRSRHCSAHLG